MSRRNKKTTLKSFLIRNRVSKTGYIITKNGKHLINHGKDYPLVIKIGRYTPTPHNISDI